MNLQEFLARLHKVSGPNASGEYAARCPCHDDRTASLSIREKVSSKDRKRRIYFHCHTGQCTTETILQALGIAPKDLIVDGEPLREIKDGTAPKGVKVYQAKPMPPPAKDKPKEKEQEVPKIDLGKPTKIYPYTDAGGKELFQVLRYEYEAEGKRQKTFRQRHRDPAHPKANREGWVWSVPEVIRMSTLYRMPEVTAAMAEGRTVYLVEGEKDADTLHRLGYAATCNPGGAGKWAQAYTMLLTGADVVVLPDCDSAANHYAGQEHAWRVAAELTAHAKRVRMPDLRAACPELPDKGDITDMVELMGEAPAMDALARQLAATREFDPMGIKFWLTPMEQAAGWYQRVNGYCAENGAVCTVGQDGAVKPLCDFVVLPRMELTRDDGATTSVHFVLDGWNNRGKKLDRVVISSKQMDSMGWVTEKWGFGASVMPGNTISQKLAWAIKKVGQMVAKSVTEYNHTGWRRIAGRWCYLYQGGAIGMEGVTVELGASLERYRLDGGGAEGFDQIDLREAAGLCFRFTEVMGQRIAIPLLGTVFLAPLRSFMEMGGDSPAYALFLLGGTGTRKSTVAALGLSFFGNFNSRTLPASFNDTANYIRKKAFLVKDMPLVVDDYHPVRSIQERRQMESVAGSLARAFGDGAERGRLNADATARTSNPPRCVAIISGEDLPGLEDSALARFFIVNVEKGDVPAKAELTEVQELARRGYLQKVMRGYIEWLAVQADELPDQLHAMFQGERQEMAELMAGQHGRAPEAAACILMGYSFMIRYLINVGVMNEAGAEVFIQVAKKALVSASKAQAADLESEKPSRMFLSGIAELMASGTVMLHDLTEGAKQRVARDMIGYMDDRWLYLLPNKALGAVTALCREQGKEFPVSLKALYKHLKTDGVLTGGKEDEPPTRNKWIDGKAVRLLWIPREAVEGPKIDMEQMMLNLHEADETDNPFTKTCTRRNPS